MVSKMQWVSVPPCTNLFRDSILEKGFVYILIDKDVMWIPCKIENNLGLAARQSCCSCMESQG